MIVKQHYVLGRHHFQQIQSHGGGLSWRFVIGDGEPSSSFPTLEAAIIRACDPVSKDEIAAKNNGGAAFPHQFERVTNHPRFAESEGMTLRDWFAGQALAGLVAFPGRAGESNEPEHFARWAYGVADAMIKARQS